MLNYDPLVAYEVVFNFGNENDLGTFLIKGNYIHVFVKTQPLEEPKQRTIMVRKGSKYYDRIHMRYTYLMMAMKKLNRAIPNENIRVHIEPWLNPDWTKNIMEGILQDVEEITYVYPKHYKSAV